MKFNFVLWSLGAALLLGMAPAWAGPITLTNASAQGWAAIDANTFGLPADLTSINCGSEDFETTCEPVGVFDFSVSLTTTGVYNYIDSAGGISDQIVIDNSAPGGLGELKFYSDPSLPGLSGGTAVCQEGNFGCVHAFDLYASGGQEIVLSAWSDGEYVYDPYGLGADSSDELQIVSGAVAGTPGVVPEPAALYLFGTGLLGLLVARRRRLVSF